MARAGTELLLGVLQDPQFGPLVVVGFGGIYVEVLRDTTVRLAQHAQRQLDRTARRLKHVGWAVETVRIGVPLVELLNAAQEPRVDVLVLGARGVGGIDRLLLGSVAEEALSRAAPSVLIVR